MLKFLKNRFYIAMPRIIAVEGASICQLKCPECPTGRGENKNSEVGRGTLSLEMFQEIVDKNPWIKNISLINWGEIFLNKQLPQIIRYASEKNVRLEAFGGVNFNTVSDEALLAMVKYGFGRLNVSIDGATQETYEIYRKGGNIETVFENVWKLLALKKQYNAESPVVIWKYVVFGHNEEDIPLAIKMKSGFGIPIDFQVQWNDSYSPVKDVEKVRQLTGMKYVTQEETIKSTGRENGVLDSCACLWNLPIINWDKKILGCCVNTWGNFGTADLNDLEASINNEKMILARKMLMGHVPEDPSVPCAKCHHYQVYKQTNHFITESEVLTFNKTGIIRWAFGKSLAKVFMKHIFPAILRLKRSFAREKSAIGI
jgi:MoaA/NifB/PqqE/SkfB family radical SAM enzyme